MTNKDSPELDYEPFDYTRILSGNYATVMYIAEHTPLPELLEIFGEGQFVKFLQAFAGRTLRVPSADEIKRHVRDIELYKAVDDGMSLREAAGKFGLDSLDSVRQIKNKVERRLRTIDATRFEHIQRLLQQGAIKVKDNL
jgi:hypothetical protein